MALLNIIQDATDLLSLPRPASVINSTDLQVRQLFAIAVEEAQSLAKSYNWQALTKEYTFTTLATPAQPAIPSDLDRFIHNTTFNRTTRRPVLGPVTPQLWQAIQANPAINRIILAFRERGGAYLTTPTPPAGQTIGYEYVSSLWALAADGVTAKLKWTMDTDLTYLDEPQITLGVRWRWRKSKGLPYGEDFDSYDATKRQLQARDGGSTTLDITGRSNYDYVGNPNLPEGGFGQ